MGVRTVVLDGGFTDCCVLNAAFDASQPQLPRRRAPRPRPRHQRRDGGRGAEDGVAASRPGDGLPPTSSPSGAARRRSPPRRNDFEGHTGDSAPMKMIDLSHPMSVHTPGWVGYAGEQDVLRPEPADGVDRRAAHRHRAACRHPSRRRAPRHRRARRRHGLLPARVPGRPRRDHRHLRQGQRLVADHPGHDQLDRREDREGRHPDAPHRLPPVLRGAAAAGPRPLFLHAPGRQARAGRLDARQGRSAGGGSTAAPATTR